MVVDACDPSLTREAEAERVLGFKNSLGNGIRLCLKNNNKKDKRLIHPSRKNSLGKGVVVLQG